MNKSFFLKQFFTNFKHTGAVLPSSKALTCKMLKGIDFSKPLRILELGPGTGCMTESMLSQMHQKSELVCIEINPLFCKELKKFESDKKFTLHEASALDISTLLGDDKVDFVVSGLPLANFEKTEIACIFQEIEKILKPDGKYIQFQYTLKLNQLFKNTFQKVSKSFAFFNVPPAFVFSCSF